MTQLFLTSEIKLNKEFIAIYSKNYNKDTNTICKQNAELLISRNAINIGTRVVQRTKYSTSIVTIK
jgi:hypothetical protein